MVICDIEIACKILEGEEEDKYLAKVTEEMMNSKNKYNKKRGNKKGKIFLVLELYLSITLYMYYNDALPC